jgi:hypothetical protein
MDAKIKHLRNLYCKFFLFNCILVGLHANNLFLNNVTSHLVSVLILYLCFIDRRNADTPRAGITRESSNDDQEAE